MRNRGRVDQRHAGAHDVRDQWAPERVGRRAEDDRGRVRYAFKFGGTLPPEVLAKIEACIDKYEKLGLDKTGDFDQQQKLPDCLPLATAQGTVNAVSAFVSSLTDDHWCASPSGAFLD